MLRIMFTNSPGVNLDVSIVRLIGEIHGCISSILVPDSIVNSRRLARRGEPEKAKGPVNLLPDERVVQWMYNPRLSSVQDCKAQKGSTGKYGVERRKEPRC